MSATGYAGGVRRLLLAAVLVAGVGHAGVPATALAPEYAVALPPGSVRILESCDPQNLGYLYCYEVPGDLGDVVHAIAQQLRAAGYELRREDATIDSVEQWWVRLDPLRFITLDLRAEPGGVVSIVMASV